MNVSEATRNHIRDRMDDTIDNLPEHLKSWAEEHIIEFMYVDVSEKTEGDYTKRVIQVTGDTGHRDSSSHVYFDEAADKFGLVYVLEGGFRWAMGIYGEFDSAIQGM